MPLETVTHCPVCNGQSFQEFLSAKDHTLTKESFHLEQCEGCGFVLTNPRPDNNSIGKYYESPDYISHSGGGTSLFDSAYRLARKWTTTRKRKTIERFQSSGQLLDIGCGTGDFLGSFDSTKWKLAGVEPSPTARKKIPEKAEKYTQLSDYQIQTDAVTMWHVIEHVHNPNETLQQIRKLIKETGTLFIAVPNRESFDAKHYGAHWAAYDVPRHLSHFSKKDMKALLEKNRFELQAFEAMPLDAFYVSMLSEKYLGENNNFVSRTLSAIKTGLLSNLKAKQNNYSSLLYIARPC